MLGPVEPIKMTGHESNLRHCEFYTEKFIVSCSDDKTVRLWDVGSAQEVKKLEFPNIVSDIEVSTQNRMLTLTHGNTVAFWSLDK